MNQLEAQSMGGLTLKETHLCIIQAIASICMRKHLGLRLSLWHRYEVNRTLIGFLGIICSSRTTSCWPNVVWPTEVLASATIIVMTIAPQHTNNHRWNGSSNGHIYVRHKGNIYYINFLWNKIGIHLKDRWYTPRNEVSLPTRETRVQPTTGTIP